MDTRFRGVWPFITYRVKLQSSKEEVLSALKEAVAPAPIVGFNFIPLGRPRRLQGQAADEGVHITCHGTGHKGGQVILHGQIEAENGGVCTLRYRLMPNNYTLLFGLLLLCFAAGTLKYGLVWRGLAVAAGGTALCVLLGVLAAAGLNTRLNEVLKQYVKE